MNKLRFSLFIGATLLVSLALCSNAQAQTRVFISGVGSDVNLEDNGLDGAFTGLYTAK